MMNHGALHSVSRSPDRPDLRPGAGIDLSLVIPAYNEADCVSPLWDRLRPVLEQCGRRWELIWVDDGSTDATRARVEAVRRDDRRVRLLMMDRHRGQSAALDAGFRAARGAWILTLDADLQNPPEEIPRLLEAAAAVDLVFGRRRHRRDGWIKRAGSRLGNAARNLITGHRVHDTGCSLKLYRADALRRIPRFHGMHRFVPSLFHYHGFRIREIDVDHRPRFAGQSKYGNFARARRGLVDCLAMRWMRRRALDYAATESDDEGDPAGVASPE